MTTRVITPARGRGRPSARAPSTAMSAVMYLPGQDHEVGLVGEPRLLRLGHLPHGRAHGRARHDPAEPGLALDGADGVPARYHNLTMLPDGTVLASGGTTASDGTDLTKAVLPAEIWDPPTETWTTSRRCDGARVPLDRAAAARRPRADGRRRPAAAAARPTSRTREIYSPPYLFKGARPTITTAPALRSVRRGFTSRRRTRRASRRSR